MSRRNLLLSAWLVALVASAIWVGLTWQDNRDERAQERDVTSARESASADVEALFSYRPGALPGDLDREEDLLTEEFAEDYRAMIVADVMPSATRGQLAADAAVVEDSVVSTSGSRVDVLLYVNITASGKASRAPETRGSRLVVTMRKQDDAWLVDGITSV